MATVSKFTLNPLATCFIPSSMKYLSMTSATFSTPSYEPFINENTRAKNGQHKITTNERNTDLTVVKAQTNPLMENLMEDPLVANTDVREAQSYAIEEDEVFEEPLTTKAVLSTMNETSRKETPVKSDDEYNSEQHAKVSMDLATIDSKDTILTKLNLSLPNQTIISKISKLLKDGIKPLWVLLPFTVRSMLVMEFFYRVGLRTISLNMAMKTSLLCSVQNPNLKSVTCTKKAKRTKIKRKTKSNECHCPPMFGWILPLQLFGNPLKLPENCDKDYVHMSYVDENSRQPQSEHFESFESSINDEKLTLEQCSLELKAVIKDVCDSISLYDEDNLITKSGKRSVWGTETAKEIEKENSSLDIIDDGIHPLLQESQEADSEDTEIPKIQAFLGEAFSLHENSSGEEILPSQSVCNLPCSIWCNKVPPPAKDAYKRFIRNLDSESAVCSKVADNKKKVLKKPLYKRCFSADDTPKNYDKMPFLPTSSFESKERLLLLHKDPVSFIKQSRTSALKDINHKSKSKYSVTSEQVETKENSNENLDKWSLYDGADSMWQPLPECIPSSDIAQKHFHRKARDMRRQKSVC